jgi:dihydropyrimidinase
MRSYFIRKNEMKQERRLAETSTRDTLYPGVCDFHVHVGERIGGYMLREDFEAVDRIAAQQGIVGIGAFVTEERGLPLKEKLSRMREDAAKYFSGHVHWHLTPVSSGPEDVIPLLEEGCDLKLYTTYKKAGLYSSYERIERWMQDLSGLKPRMLVHCEDNGIIERYSAKYPFRVPFDHTLRRPELAESFAVGEIMDLAVKYDYPVHIVHVSTPVAALIINDARKSNPKITCEAAPHYLFNNEDILKGENAHRLLCSPPYRSESSRGLLVELLQDGVFDILASDHCPFTDEDKDRHKTTPEKVPCGIPGLASLFPSCYDNLVQNGVISLERLVSLVCVRPAELMGLRAEPEFDLERFLGRDEG